MNSIVIYLGRSAAATMLPFNYISGPMNTHWARLPETLLGCGLWFLVAYEMYRRKVFVVV